jgi:hypothetical protein
MKKLLSVGLAFLALVLGGCGSQPQADKPAEKSAKSSMKPERDPKVIEEIRGTLAQHDKALRDKNLAAVMDTFVDDPETVALGTSNGERWVGTENIKNAYTRYSRTMTPTRSKPTVTGRPGRTSATWLGWRRLVRPRTQ